MSKQAGFIKWEIHRSSDEEYTDIVSWASRADAKKAESDMINMPNANEWYACYKQDSISCKRLSQVTTLTGS